MTTFVSKVSTTSLGVVGLWVVAFVVAVVKVVS